MQDFLSWAANATLEKDLEWVKSDDGSNDDEDEDDGGSEDSSNSTWEEIIFDDLYPVETLTLNKYKLDLGFELHFECEGCANSDTPNDFNMSVTDSTDRSPTSSCTRRTTTTTPEGSPPIGRERRCTPSANQWQDGPLHVPTTAVRSSGRR